MFKNMFYIGQNKKNTIRITSGSIIAQLISIITLPVITRLYGASVIGIWAFIYSLSMIVRSFSDLGMSHAIMIEEKDLLKRTYEAISTVALFASIISSFAIVIYFLIVPSGYNLFYLFIIIFILTFTLKQIQICYTWLNRNGDYKALMKNPIINNVIYGASAILFAVLGFKVYGYFVAHILGQLVTLLHMKRKLPNGFLVLNLEKMKYIFRRNIKFIKYQMPANILSNFKHQLPTLLVQIFWGETILGYYSITVKILQLPSTFIANAIGRVFFDQIAKLKRKGRELGSYVIRNLKLGLILGALPLIVLLGVGDHLIVLFFGTEWQIAGVFIRILSLQYMFNFIINTIQGLSTVLNKQKYSMISNFLLLFLIFTAFLIGKVYFNDIFASLIMLTIATVVVNIGYIFALLITMKQSGFKFIMFAGMVTLLTIAVSLIFRLLIEKIGLFDYIYDIFGLH